MDISSSICTAAAFSAVFSHLLKSLHCNHLQERPTGIWHKRITKVHPKFTIRKTIHEKTPSKKGSFALIWRGILDTLRFFPSPLSWVSRTHFLCQSVTVHRKKTGEQPNCIHPNNRETRILSQFLPRSFSALLYFHLTACIYFTFYFICKLNSLMT